MSRLLELIAILRVAPREIGTAHIGWAVAAAVFVVAAGVAGAVSW